MGFHPHAVRFRTREQPCFLRSRQGAFSSVAFSAMHRMNKALLLRGKKMISPMMVMVAMMMPENNRRQGDTKRKSRTCHHGSRGNGLRRYVVPLIHGNGAAFLICIGVVGHIGRRTGHPARHGIVVAGAQGRCNKHPACPSVCLFLHDKWWSLSCRTPP